MIRRTFYQRLERALFAFRIAILAVVLSALGGPLYGAQVYDSGFTLDHRFEYVSGPVGIITINEECISVWSQPNWSGWYGSTSLDFDGSNFLGPGLTLLDPPFSWYTVNEGQVIDAALVATTTPYVSNCGPYNPTTLTLSIGDRFLLGVWLDADDNNTTSAGDCYGWVRLERTATGLNLVDSGVADSGVGIIAGTFETVPEPSTFALIFFALGPITLWQILRRAHGRAHTPSASS